jgi:8-amino-7-oxononanoate synthase
MNRTHATARQREAAKLLDKVRSFTRARQLQKAGLYPYFKPICESNGTVLVIEGQQKLNMGSNNYLGLTHHPRIIEAGCRAVEKYGAGCTGSRFLNGTIDLHEQLEEDLARFLGKEAALVYTTGYQANLGFIMGLVNRNDLVIIDKASHASLIDGARSCFGRWVRYDHGDLRQLEELLQQNEDVGVLLAVDGVHSMEGDIADVPGLARLARRYGAVLAIDDAHSIGVLGKHGDGTASHFGVQNEVDLIVGTFSKSLANIGGFVAGNQDVIHYLKHHSRPLIFSAALPPFTVASVLEALKVLQSEPHRRAQLWQNSERMSRGLQALGFDLGSSQTPILPVIIGDDELTFRFWKRLFDEGVFTNPVVSPAVPYRQGRLRVSLIATHEPGHIDAALDAFGRVGREFGLV